MLEQPAAATVKLPDSWDEVANADRVGDCGTAIGVPDHGFGRSQLKPVAAPIGKGIPDERFPPSGRQNGLDPWQEFCRGQLAGNVWTAFRWEVIE